MSRDKDCPGCQQEEGNEKPVELSHREQLWEERVQRMKLFAGRDPYNAVFGSARETGLLDKLKEDVQRWRGMNTPSPSLWPAHRGETSSSEEEHHNRNPWWARMGHLSSFKATLLKNDSWWIRKANAALGANDNLKTDSIFKAAADTVSTEKKRTFEGQVGKASIPTESSKDLPFDRARHLQFDLISSRWIPKAHAEAVVPSSEESAAIEIPTKTSTQPLNEANNQLTEIQGLLFKKASEHFTNTKEALEQSWKSERHLLGRSHSRQEVRKLAMRSREIVHEIRKCAHQLHKLRMEQAHFREAVPTSGSNVTKDVYTLINRRDRPYKHMTPSEIGNHRAALLASWETKHKPSSPPTPAEIKLKEEIDQQKLAMNAFEDKWRHRSDSRSHSAKASTISLGEGDVDPNIGQFVNTERYYKMKAPHALDGPMRKLRDIDHVVLTERSRKLGESSSRDLDLYESAKLAQKDRTMVGEIREIYESTYGTIDTNHTQKPTKNISSQSGGETSPSTPSLLIAAHNSHQDFNPTTPLQVYISKDYERDNGNNMYSFTAGQDNLEEELKSSSVMGSLASPGSKVPAILDNSSDSADRYIFTSGQDNLEEELKSSSVMGSLAPPGSKVSAILGNVPKSRDRSTSQSSQDNLEEEFKPSSVIPGSIDQYTFTSGQDNLENELKSSSVMGRLVPPGSVVAKILNDAPKSISGHMPASEQNKLEGKPTATSMGKNPVPAMPPDLSSVQAPPKAKGRYVFTTGQDNLEEELKTSSVMGALGPSSAHSSKSMPWSSTDLKQQPESQQASNQHIYKILKWDTFSKTIRVISASSNPLAGGANEKLRPRNYMRTKLLPSHKFRRFLPKVSGLGREGYAVLMATGNVLILKRIRPAEATNQSLTSVNVEGYDARKSVPDGAEQDGVKDSIDSSSRREPPPVPQTGNFASPTGFVNHDVYCSPSTIAAEKPSSGPAKANRRIRKEEPVFSGSPRWDGVTSTSTPKATLESTAAADNTPDKSSTGKTNSSDKEKTNGENRSPSLRSHLAVTTVTVAGLCYITGVIVEWLRDGPHGGYGGGSSGPGGMIAGAGSEKGASLWPARSSAHTQVRDESEEMLQTTKVVMQVVGFATCCLCALGVVESFVGER